MAITYLGLPTLPQGLVEVMLTTDLNTRHHFISALGLQGALSLRATCRTASSLIDPLMSEPLEIIIKFKPGSTGNNFCVNSVSGALSILAKWPRCTRLALTALASPAPRSCCNPHTGARNSCISNFGMDCVQVPFLEAAARGHVLPHITSFHLHADASPPSAPKPTKRLNKQETPERHQQTISPRPEATSTPAALKPSDLHPDFSRGIFDSGRGYHHSNQQHLHLYDHHYQVAQWLVHDSGLEVAPDGSIVPATTAAAPAAPAAPSKSKNQAAAARLFSAAPTYPCNDGHLSHATAAAASFLFGKPPPTASRGDAGWRSSVDPLVLTHHLAAALAQLFPSLESLSLSGHWDVVQSPPPPPSPPLLPGAGTGDTCGRDPSYGEATGRYAPAPSCPHPRPYQLDPAEQPDAAGFGATAPHDPAPPLAALAAMRFLRRLELPAAFVYDPSAVAASGVAHLGASSGGGGASRGAGGCPSLEDLVVHTDAIHHSLRQRTQLGWPRALLAALPQLRGLTLVGGYSRVAQVLLPGMDGGGGGAAARPLRLTLYEHLAFLQEPLSADALMYDPWLGWLLLRATAVNVRRLADCMRLFGAAAKNAAAAAAVAGGGGGGGGGGLRRVAVTKLLLNRAAVEDDWRLLEGFADQPGCSMMVRELCITYPECGDGGDGDGGDGDGDGDGAGGGVIISNSRRPRGGSGLLGRSLALSASRCVRLEVRVPAGEGEVLTAAVRHLGELPADLLPSEVLIEEVEELEAAPPGNAVERRRRQRQRRLVPAVVAALEPYGHLRQVARVVVRARDDNTGELVDFTLP
ncbi:hypothetical protein VOLCADRAFT_99627 [Volvox carteri f. nagariensis]|uniref:Uncharacterized protein n=1 Tax=Volvox carteri f. nagariensis TaxID=3068 RepID=D8UI60_VOLCA|nr:uncharacterized protein VOLCADRAFT_99627 [Volvox carteri f. nagariensis]EFJ40588.1 hypothetical protein VOLCADRAFT_99627 [Volvox carteri f. nagariensis]|eukprot:XP_002958366.1 hypothetical protein VOLCADRAFT_99627 [Volvox carteri f. nagariensis]